MRAMVSGVAEVHAPVSCGLGETTSQATVEPKPRVFLACAGGCRSLRAAPSGAGACTTAGISSMGT